MTPEEKKIVANALGKPVDKINDKDIA